MSGTTGLADMRSWLDGFDFYFEIPFLYLFIMIINFCKHVSDDLRLSDHNLFTYHNSSEPRGS